MKNIFFTIVALFYVPFSQAQRIAITEKGEVVLLNANGTWRPQPKDSSFVISLNMDSLNTVEAKSIPQNLNKYESPRNATHLIKSKKVKVGLYINNKYWGVRRGEINEYSEYYFFNKVDDGYAQFYSENTTGLTLADLQKSILRSTRSEMTDAYIKMSEYRWVNGIKVICTNVIGTMNNFKSESLTYSFITEEGIVKLGIYNSQSKFEKYRELYENFLNGLVLLK